VNLVGLNFVSGLGLIINTQTHVTLVILLFLSHCLYFIKDLLHKQDSDSFLLILNITDMNAQDSALEAADETSPAVHLFAYLVMKDGEILALVLIYFCGLVYDHLYFLFFML